jgi:cell division protein FtsI (penicillin-binding protein 3)
LDSKPLGGIELSLNDYLVRKQESKSYRRDARGHLYLSPADTVAIRPPNVVELTIDKTIQYIDESTLAETMEKSKGIAGTIVVLDPRNGEILAMANMPTFDPNHYGDYDLDSWKNRAISDPYEPGSTFKVISVASALEQGTVTANDEFDCEHGEITIGEDTLHDSKAHGDLSVHDIIRVSSNIGAYKISKTLGNDRVAKYIKNFGFGSKTKVRLNGESAGIVLPASEWTETHLATIAFGQGISATPLQMSMAFAAIANGGYLLRPHIVKRVIDDKGDIIFEAEREVRRRPIKRDTGRMMTRMLQAVASEEGTGALAESLEYPTAGKTGTAQKPSRRGGYMKNKYYASFVGFAPADDPRLVVYVGIDEPKGYYYGGQVAAPAFREVVEKTLKYLKVPSLRRLAKGKKKKVDKRAAYVESHMPIAPRELPKVKMVGNREWKLPDFSGLTMKGVMEAVLGVPLEFRFMGSGIAVNQYPAAGSTVEKGEECVVEFRSLL